MDLIRYFENKQTKDLKRPLLKAGDIIRVETKIKEGEKSRLQAFEGTVLGIRGSGPSATLTVRREAGRFAVERIFPLYSPLISNIDVIKRQKVRRAKLAYLRQAGRRRVKEDELSMQRHLSELQEQKRVKEAAKKKAEKEKIAVEKEEQATKKPATKDEQPTAPTPVQQPKAEKSSDTKSEKTNKDSAETKQE